MIVLKNILLVGGAGAVGATLRYLTALLAIEKFPDAPFVGALIVNVLGCLAFGAVFQASENASWGTPEARLVLLAGFMGAFTTFSTFAFDTVQLYDSRGLPAAALYVLAQNGLGILCTALGMTLGRTFSAG